MNRLSVLATFKIKPDRHNEMQQLIDSVYKASIQEPGCLEYRWYQDKADPNVFHLFMTWESQQAFDDHVATEHVVEADKKIIDMLSEPYGVLFWDYLQP